MQTEAVRAFNESLPEGTAPPEGYIPDEAFGRFYLETSVVRERGMKKRRILGLGSMEQALPLLKIAPAPSSVSVVSRFDPAVREELESMRAREQQRDEETQQLREHLEESRRRQEAMEAEAQESRRRQEAMEAEAQESRRRQEAMEAEAQDSRRRQEALEEKLSMIMQYVQITPPIAQPTPTPTPVVQQHTQIPTADLVAPTPSDQQTQHTTPSDQMQLDD